jgi:hypothetical protein
MKEDITVARAVILRYQADRDDRLIKAIGKMLQYLHDDVRPRPHLFEVTLMNLQIDLYEENGRFSEAKVVKQARMVLVHEYERLRGEVAA